MPFGLLNKARRRPSTPSRRTSYRPSLEALEDRCLLSAGTLDPTFGSGGIVTTSFGSNLQTVSRAVAVQPADGKIVEAGYSINPKSLNVGYIDLARYNSNGTLDTSFGSGGTVQTKLGYRPDIRAVTLQPDGKIVVAGSGGDGSHFLLGRYNANGTLDTSFGTRGFASTAFGWLGAAAYAVTTETVNGQTDIVAVGGVNAGTSEAFAVARYNPNGSLDTTFGSGGVVVNDVSAGNDDLFGVAIQADGKIVATGGANGSQVSNGQGGFIVVRYNLNGTLDSTFGSGGIVQTTFQLANGSYAGGTGYAVAVQSNGAIVASGNLNGGTVVRYNADGSLDSTFGQGGIVLEPQLPSFGTMSLTSTGQIVVGGGQTVARFNADGTLDTTFGSGGVATVNLGKGGIMDLALQADGNIVLAADNNSTFEVARILGS